MTFVGDQDSRRDPNLPPDHSEKTQTPGQGEGGTRSPSYPRSEGTTPGGGRRTPPPLPDQDRRPHPEAEPTDPLSDGRRSESSRRAAENGLESGAESASRAARANREGREAAMGSSSRERSGSSRSGQVLAPRRSLPSSQDAEGSPYPSSYRGEPSYRSSYRSSAGYRAPYGGGGGAGIGEGSSATGGGLFPSSLTVVALVALLAFFGGFATRNLFSESGGFDDERPIRAANIPQAFRDFCFAYNGTASFTVVQLTSVSALTMASVPVYKMDTCTIPVSQTANALQALGIRGRANTLGPQLGGSNLTLIELPLASSLARAIYSQFPGLANQGNEAQVLSQLETTINNALKSNVEGLALQSLEPTNIPNVYVMVPGHSFDLQPQLNLR